MGRGSSKSLGKKSGQKVDILDSTDIWSYRHRPSNAPFSDQISEAVRDIQRHFPDVMDDLQTIDSVKLGGKGKTDVLGFYSYELKTLGMNENYTNIDKMNKVYDAAVADGFHPSRGKNTGTMAVTYHELGHALTNMVARKQGVKFDDAAANIVKAAYKKAPGKLGKGGNLTLAKDISGYAQKNYAECVAEAVCDFYCNGINASNGARIIMSEMFKYGKGRSL